MLDDEKQLIVMLRIRQGPLGRQQGIEMQIAAVSEPFAQISGDFLFYGSLIGGLVHGVLHWQTKYQQLSASSSRILREFTPQKIPS